MQSVFPTRPLMFYTNSLFAGIKKWPKNHLP